MHPTSLHDGRHGAAIEAAPADPRDASGNPGSADSERVVLVHCSASSARQWDRLVEQLVTFRTVAVNLHGHGKGERWHGLGPLGLLNEAAAIHDAYPAGELFHLVGHSYGGAVALAVALNFPERLRSLTLIEPSCFHLLAGSNASHAHAHGEIRAVAEAVTRAVICGDYRGGMEVFIDYWGGAGSWRKTPEEKRMQFASLAIYVAHHFRSLFEDTTPLAVCKRLDVPTLILCGSKSPRPSRLIAGLLADTIPHAQHRTIADANHMSPITHPTEVNAQILAHLMRHRARGDVRIDAAEFAPADGASAQAL